MTPQRIVDEAAYLADERGLDQLTLASLAQRLGIRVPSLYKHINGLEDVQARLAEQSRLELAQVMEQATIGRSGANAIQALANALRAWASSHPGRYAATVAAQKPGCEPSEAAKQALVVFLRVLANGEETTDDEIIHRARALRAAIHGFVDLELRGGFGFPVEIDASFEWLIRHLSHQLLDSK